MIAVLSEVPVCVRNVGKTVPNAAEMWPTPRTGAFWYPAGILLYSGTEYLLQLSDCILLGSYCRDIRAIIYSPFRAHHVRIMISRIASCQAHRVTLLVIIQLKYSGVASQILQSHSTRGILLHRLGGDLLSTPLLIW